MFLLFRQHLIAILGFSYFVVAPAKAWPQLDDQVVKVQLDFKIIGMDVDADGDMAVVWGKDIPELTGRNFQQNLATEGSDEVAVVDFRQGKVMIQRTFQAGIKSASIDRDFVWLVPRSGTVLYRVDRTNLRNNKRLLFEKPIQSTFRYSEQMLGVVGGRPQSASIKTLNRQTMELSPDQKANQNELFFGSSQQPYFQVSPNQISLPGRIINQKTGKLVALTKPMFPSLVANDRPQNFGQEPVLQERFGRKLVNQALVSRSGSTIARIPGNHWLSAYHPVLFSIAHEYEPSSSSRAKRIQKTYLEYRDLIEANLYHRVLLDARDLPRQHDSPRTYLTSQKKNIVVGAIDTLMQIRIDTERINSNPMSLHLQWPTDAFLPVQKDCRISVKASGGTGELVYGLLNQQDFFQINASTGEITVDTARLWQSYLDREFSGPRSGRLTSRRSSGKVLTHEETARFERMAGRAVPPGAFPLSLPIEIGVSDESGQEDRIRFYVVVLAPEKDVVQRLAQVTRERDERLKLARQQQRERENERQRQINMNLQAVKNGNVYTDKLDALEARMRRAEMVFDTILKKLERIDKTLSDKK